MSTGPGIIRKGGELRIVMSKKKSPRSFKRKGGGRRGGWEGQTKVGSKKKTPGIASVEEKIVASPCLEHHGEKKKERAKQRGLQ